VVLITNIYFNVNPKCNKMLTREYINKSVIYYLDINDTTSL